jgi:MFS transporter, PAT family, beta-lactamase induction signal transducer AmpG
LSAADPQATGWRSYVPVAVRQYTETAPLLTLFLGVSSGAPYALIAATLTTRLAQDGIDKRAVTAFSLAFLAYNLKWLWAWVVDSVRLPVIGRLGQRVSWMLLAGALAMAAVANLALVDPTASLASTAVAAILVAMAGATYDIVIDAYRIESLTPEQLGVGSGMYQYGFRIGAVAAASLALVLAARIGWHAAYLICGLFALPAMAVALVFGEPKRHQALPSRPGYGAIVTAIIGPIREFFERRGALLVLLFVLLHKVGDTLANLTLRLLLQDLRFSNDAIAIYDVGFGFWAYLAGVFVGGVLYARLGMKKAVMISLWLMAVSNLSFAALAMIGSSNGALAAAIGFENFSSGIGGVAVVAYLSALCDMRYTAAQYALLSAAASVVGRVLTGTTAGALVESLGYVNYYLFTTLIALPGIVLFWLLMRAGVGDMPKR